MINATTWVVFCVFVGLVAILGLALLVGLPAAARLAARTAKDTPSNRPTPPEVDTESLLPDRERTVRGGETDVE